MQLQLTNQVLAIVFGASEGASGILFRPDGAEKVFHMKIPWIMIDGKATYWPVDWLKEILAMTKRYVKPGDIIAPAMWGADIYTDHSMLRHYASVSDEHLEKALALGQNSQLEMYLATGGANVAAYQPLGQIMAMMADRAIWLASESIDLVANLMTYMLTGIPVFDAIMAQSQGLLKPKAYQFYQNIFPGHEGKIGLKRFPYSRSWPSDKNTILHHDGIYFTPTSHDSVFSRMVGFSTGCEWVIWTGSWLGTATKVSNEVQPSAQTFEAGVAFEGLGESRAAITNIAKLGTLYKRLVEAAGMNYQSMSDHACEMAIHGKLYDGHFLEKKYGQLLKNEDEAFSWILKNGTPKYACGQIISLAAYYCRLKIEATAKVLGVLVPTTVALTGGWAANKAFHTMLKREHFEVVIPREAQYATHAGIAADALRRYMLQTTDQPCTFAEALAVLPEFK